MDYQRYGYTCLFRIPTDAGDVVVPYRFVLADRNAPLCPAGHMFNSLNWGDRGEQRYGEIAGTRKWAYLSDGDAAFFRGFKAHGTSDELAGNAACRIVSRQPYGEFLRLPECIALSAAAAAMMDVSNRSNAAAMSAFTWALYNYSDSQFDDLVHQFLGADAEIHHFLQPTSLMPKAVGIKSRFGWIVIVEGTTNEVQLLGQVMSSGVHPINSGAIDGSVIPLTVARNYLHQLRASGMMDTDSVLFVGHSYGGAIATLMSGLRTQSADTGDNALMTFGMPRHLGQGTSTIVRERVPHRQYITVGDVVPFLPPHDSVLPWLIPLVGPTLADVWNDYHTLPTSTVVQIGSAYQEIPSDADAATLEGVLTDFITTGTLTLSSDHSIENYVKQLANDEENEIPAWINDEEAWDLFIDTIVPDTL